MAQPLPVTRGSRKQCWESRDAYYACLTSHGIVAPPGTDMSDTKGPLGRGAFQGAPRSEADKARAQAEERSADPCASQRDAYEGSCAHSWVDYFNKRRVLDARQKQFYAEAEARVVAKNK